MTELRDLAGDLARSSTPSGADPVAGSAGAQQPLWTVQYRLVLVTVDLCAIILATILGYELRFGAGPAGISSVGYLGIGLAIAVGWTVALQTSGGYEIRHIATGPEELKRVLRASGLTLSVLAIGCYVTKTPITYPRAIGVLVT